MEAGVTALQWKDGLTELEATEEKWWLFFVPVAFVFVATTRLWILKLNRNREVG